MLLSQRRVLKQQITRPVPLPASVGVQGWSFSLGEVVTSKPIKSHKSYEDQVKLEGGNLLANTLETFPHNEIIPFEQTGAPNHWRDLPLWAN